MVSILHQLFFGELLPSEQFAPTSKEYHDAAEEYCVLGNALEEDLLCQAPFLLHRFKKVQDAHFHYSSLESSEMFVSGFRLGARMMLEILDTPKST